MYSANSRGKRVRAHTHSYTIRLSNNALAVIARRSQLYHAHAHKGQHVQQVATQVQLHINIIITYLNIFLTIYYTRIMHVYTLHRALRSRIEFIWAEAAVALHQVCCVYVILCTPLCVYKYMLYHCPVVYTAYSDFLTLTRVSVKNWDSL